MRDKQVAEAEAAVAQRKLKFLDREIFWKEEIVAVIEEILLGSRNIFMGLPGKLLPIILPGASDQLYHDARIALNAVIEDILNNLARLEGDKLFENIDYRLFCGFTPSLRGPTSSEAGRGHGTHTSPVSTSPSGGKPFSWPCSPGCELGPCSKGLRDILQCNVPSW